MICNTLMLVLLAEEYHFPFELYTYSLCTAQIVQSNDTKTKNLANVMNSVASFKNILK